MNVNGYPSVSESMPWSPNLENQLDVQKRAQLSRFAVWHAAETALETGARHQAGHTATVEKLSQVAAFGTEGIVLELFHGAGLREMPYQPTHHIAEFALAAA